MKSVRHILLASILACLCPAPLAAQEEPAQPALSDLQSKQAALSDDERIALRQWVDEQVTTVNDEDPATAGKALAALRREFKGSDPFKEAYAAVLIESVGKAYKSARLAPAAQMVTVLNTMDDPGVRGVLLEALQDKRVGVRTAAAVGLRNLRVKLTLAGAPVVAEILNALRDAGKRETSTVALKAIYQAMNYPEAVPSLPDPKVNVETVLDLLEARAGRYAAGKVHAVGADAIGLELGGALRREMDDAEKKRLTIVAAKMLKYGVTRYTGGERPLHKVTKDDGKQIRELRDQIELLIVGVEQLLSTEKLLLDVATKDMPVPPEKPDGTTATIADAMKKAADPIDMKIAMNKWGDILKKAVNREFYMDEAEEPAPDDGG